MVGLIFFLLRPAGFAVQVEARLEAENAALGSS